MAHDRENQTDSGLPFPSNVSQKGKGLLGQGPGKSFEHKKVNALAKNKSMRPHAAEATPICNIPRLVMMPHVLNSQKLRILASGTQEDAPFTFTGWFTIDLPAKMKIARQADITIYGGPQMDMNAAMEDAAQAVIDYVCQTWSFRVNDINFKALDKLQASYNEARFFEDAFQDKATAIGHAFSVAKKTQKEVTNKLKNICNAFTDILPLDITVTPAATKNQNKFNLVFTGNSAQPTRINELALALLRLTEDNHGWTDDSS